MGHQRGPGGVLSLDPPGRRTLHRGSRRSALRYRAAGPHHLGRAGHLDPPRPRHTPHGRDPGREPAHRARRRTSNAQRRTRPTRRRTPCLAPTVYRLNISFPPGHAPVERSACGRRTMGARRGGASRHDSGSGPKTGRMNDRSYLSTQPLWSRIRSTAAEVGINAEQCAVVLIRGQRRNENRANARSLAPSLGRKWPRCCPPCRLTRSIHARPKCSKGSILAGSMVYSTTQVITVQG